MFQTMKCSGARVSSTHVLKCHSKLIFSIQQLKNTHVEKQGVLTLRRRNFLLNFSTLCI
jgi:hypothetical protein